MIGWVVAALVYVLGWYQCGAMLGLARHHDGISMTDREISVLAWLWPAVVALDVVSSAWLAMHGKRR